ncbi:26S proteasome regulatory subunit 5a [Cryptosporidium ryanae]|uniref:26S proteasome regulatory subunit 5a n=1 Tax=Cryptosporidium ryanae TaxID=515981 RepID=UPI00351A21FA|nr:26S proteasome regulatory subunit 5a [Cryptosporidium ryanae]
MTLEATVICLDNSNYSRNSDYGTSRIAQQQDAVNFISGIKTQQNPENLVGILSMAGERIELRVTPTSDLGKAIHSMNGMRLSGKIDIVRGIQIAQLALKHRLNKNLRQRIICFVGSPLEDDISEKQLEKLGKTLKKNNVSIDIISFGEIDVNHSRLEALVNSANNNNKSNFIEIKAPNNIVDALMSSPIVLGEGGNMINEGSASGIPGDSNAFEFGVDPSVDPELYMALRMSMEEERIRQSRIDNSNSNDANNNSSSANFDQIPTINEINAMEVDDELRQALLLSIQDFSGPNNGNNSDGNQQSDNNMQNTSQEVIQEPTRQLDDPNHNETGGTDNAGSGTGNNNKS